MTGTSDSVRSDIPNAGESFEGNGSNWIDELTGDARAVAETKRWESPSAAVESYANLERLLGDHNAGNTVALPKDNSDREAYETIYDRLGRPADSSGYNLPDPPDGLTVDQEFVDAARPALHKIGLSQSQFEQVADWYNSHAADRARIIDQRLAAEAQKQEDALKLEWGDRFDAKLETARRVLNAVPNKVADGAKILDAIEAAGVPRGDIYRLFAWMGEEVMEAKLVGEGSSGFSQTAQNARLEIEKLKGDETFRRMLFDPRAPGHADAKKRWDLLYEASNSE